MQRAAANRDSGQDALKNQRLRFIDGLRGIAATVVMFSHLAERTRAAALTHRGYLGVAIFFVLSGFVIASVVGERRMNLRFLGHFALRRMIRLDIPYWVNIVLVLLLMRLAVGFGAAGHAVSVPQIAAHLFYLQTLLGYPEISSVYWTLCLEVQFYLALILLVWAAQKLAAPPRYFNIAFLALLSLSVLDNMNWIHTPTGFMFHYWWGFALGALCYWTVVRQVPGLYLALACGLVLCSCAAVHVHADWRMTAVVTVVLIFIAARARAMGRWLADPVSQFLGRISYSLYLCHPLFGWSAQSLALRYVNQWSAMLIGIAASIVSAWIAYRFIERPSITLSHHVKMA